MNIGFYPFIHACHGQRWLSSVSVGRRGYCEVVRQQDSRQTRERAFSGVGKSYGRVFAPIERVATTLAWKRTIRR